MSLNDARKIYKRIKLVMLESLNKEIRNKFTQRIIDVFMVFNICYLFEYALYSTGMINVYDNPIQIGVFLLSLLGMFITFPTVIYSLLIERFLSNIIKQNSN